MIFKKSTICSSGLRAPLAAKFSLTVQQNFTDAKEYFTNLSASPLNAYRLGVGVLLDPLVMQLPFSFPSIVLKTNPKKDTLQGTHIFL